MRPDQYTMYREGIKPSGDRKSTATDAGVPPDWLIDAGVHASSCASVPTQGKNKSQCAASLTIAVKSGGQEWHKSLLTPLLTPVFTRHNPPYNTHCWPAWPCTGPRAAGYKPPQILILVPSISGIGRYCYCQFLTEVQQQMVLIWVYSF